MRTKYNSIGIHYNQTRKADKNLSERLLFHLSPFKVGFYLDIGCGTGNYTSVIQRQGFNLMGIDPSAIMLDKAKANNPHMDWRLGTAEETGLSDQSIDGIMAFLTMHHWVDLKQGFQELSRVLKSKGKIVLFTSTPEQMLGYWLNHYFPAMMNQSMLQMPSKDNIETALNMAGINIEKTESYFIQPDLQDLFLYCGKNDPELYFDTTVRRGISSFSAIANKKEVESGLSHLRADISSGRVYDVIKSYEHEFGDYMFIIGQKSG